MDRFEARSFLNELIYYSLHEPLVRTTDFYHVNFVGQHHLETFDLDELNERFQYFRERYNHMQCDIIEFEVINQDTIFSFVDFSAFDTKLNAPIELFLSHIFILEEGKIKQSYGLSKYQLVMKSISQNEGEEDFSLQRGARHRFEKTLNMINREVKNEVKLSAREMDCLYYYVSGLSSKESGKRLSLSYRTVEKHLENIKIKYTLGSIRDLKNMFKII